MWDHLALPIREMLQERATFPASCTAVSAASTLDDGLRVWLYCLLFAAGPSVLFCCCGLTL
jgi:hypothetical protein